VTLANIVTASSLVFSPLPFVSAPPIPRVRARRPTLSADYSVAALSGTTVAQADANLEFRIILTGAIGPDLVLRQPLPLAVERDGDCWLVSDDEFGVYGDASTLPAAFEDYVSSLRDYYQLVAERANRDNADLAQFRRLDQYVLNVEH